MKHAILSGVLIKVAQLQPNSRVTIDLVNFEWTSVTGANLQGSITRGKPYYLTRLVRVRVRV